MGLSFLLTARWSVVRCRTLTLYLNRLQCGNFLTDRWLGQSLPDPYGEGKALTPSQRKVCGLTNNFLIVISNSVSQYLDVILISWGSWELFQMLLRVLRAIGDRHGGRSIANIATRWVLDHPFVGAVLIGMLECATATCVGE
jgi:hypothetical protein